MGNFLDRLKSAVGAFKIEGDGFYLSAKIHGENVVVNQIVTRDDRSDIKVELPSKYNNYPVQYDFGSNYPPRNIACIEIGEDVGEMKFNVLTSVPRIIVNGNYRFADKLIWNLEQKECILEIRNNDDFFTCDDGRSIINRRGELLYYARSDNPDRDEYEFPEGVRSIGRESCFPKRRKLVLPASFDFGLGNNYELKDLAQRFCDFVFKFQPISIRTKPDNPVWSYDNVFLYDRKNRAYYGFIADGVTALRLTGETHPALVRKRNLNNIVRVELSRDYGINSTDDEAIRKAVNTLRFELGLFPNLKEVIIEDGNESWVNFNGLIACKKNNVVAFVLPDVRVANIPDGFVISSPSLLEKCHDIHLSDIELLGQDPSDPLFLKNLVDQMQKLPMAQRITVSSGNKELGMDGAFIFSKTQNRCIFHPQSLGSELVVPSRELVFMSGLVSQFKVTPSVVRSRYGGYREDFDKLDKFSDAYPQVESLTFPPGFDFSRLLCQQEIVNSSLDSLRKMTVSPFFPYDPKFRYDETLERIDGLFILLLKQFCNLETVKLGMNDFYENRNGILFNKQTKKVLMILPEARKVVIPSDLFINLNAVLALSSNVSHDFLFPYERYKDRKPACHDFPRKHRYYVPVKWLLNDRYLRDHGSFIGYDRFGVVPHAECKSTTYRVGARARSFQEPLPFDGYDASTPEIVERDPSVKKAEKVIEEGDTICCKLDSVVSVMNTFPCINKGHTLIPVILEVLIRKKVETKPFKVGVRAYYCRQCKRIFMYTSEIRYLRKYLLDKNRYYVFNRFSIDGSKYGYSDNPATWASESILKEAGYEVNQNSVLSQKERLNILIELNKRGVPYHTIASYLNTFINVNGASYTKDMSQAVKRWKSDLEAAKELYFKGELD